jgi:hypothetical protein
LGLMQSPISRTARVLAAIAELKAEPVQDAPVEPVEAVEA